MRTKTRCRFLATVAGSTVVGLAGCLGGDDSSDSAGSAGSPAVPETMTMASFFVFGDVVRHVVDDAVSVGTLIPVGQHGHNWKPGPDVQGRVLEFDLFVHGMPGLRPWASDTRTSLEVDGSDVPEVDASADVELHGIDMGGRVHNDEHAKELEMHDHSELDPHF